MAGGLLRPLRARLNRLRGPLDTGLDRLRRPTDAGLGSAGDPIQTSSKGHGRIRGAALIREGVASRTVRWQIDPCAGRERHISPKRGRKPHARMVRAASETLHRRPPIPTPPYRRCGGHRQWENVAAEG